MSTSRKVSVGRSLIVCHWWRKEADVSAGDILMLSEGRPGIDTLFELRDGRLVRAIFLYLIYRKSAFKNPACSKI